MKQKLLKALSLAAIAFCSVSTAWADRVAPTVPESKAPVDGGCYWLYNVATDLYIGTSSSSSSTTCLAETGDNIYLAKIDNYWTLRKNAPDGYLFSGSVGGGNRFGTTSTANSDYNKWLIKSEGNYQHLYTKVNESKKPVVYLGYPTENNNGKYLYSDRTENIDWLFYDAAEATHYAAEKALYDALVATDGRNWMRDQYEQMYNNRATATNLELHQAADALINALNMSAVSGIFCWQNDYTNLMIASEQDWTIKSSELSFNLRSGETAAITATVETTENADLSYRIGNYCGPVHVFVDNEEVRVVKENVTYGNTDRVWFNALKPGKHTIKWLFENTNSSSSRNVYLYSIGVENTPLITVNCPLPGSLGTEILYNVDNLKDVRNIKVIGDLNSEDMNRLTMLTNAHYIDLSEATCTAYVPERGFYSNQWLHTLILAEGIKQIGNSAFEYSQLENITLPPTLWKIGQDAFSNSNINHIDIPNNVTSLGDYAFRRCYNLKRATYSSGLTYIPIYAFEKCNNLEIIEIPEGVTAIRNRAFDGCENLVLTLPSSLISIESYAFLGCDAIKTLVIPDGVETIGGGAFEWCASLEEVVMPMNFYDLTHGNDIFYQCSKLKKITLNSPTVVKTASNNDQYRITNNEYRPNITLCVPDYLVVPYKLDSYWYNFGDIVGFPSEHIKDYTLHTDLYLDSHSRIAGDPNLTIENGALRIEGDAAMGITNFQTTTAFSNYHHNNSFSSLSQVRSGCENITIKGDYTHWMKLYGSRWAFVSLPFDCKVSDIIDLTEGRLHAVRYYDGAERAATGTGSSWKKFASEDAIIPAGQGFIIQVDGSTSDYNWVQFKSQDNASKQYVFSKKEFSKHLDKNPSSVESNQGWNLVGNPYQCYYDIHKLNFTAPITVWDGSNRTYAAYSIIDDDYALRPNEAFFVQCPSALDAITFPVGGKQFDATILTQNASQRRAAATSSRKMLNLTLSNDEATDQTRIVINDEASLGYETTCDASKFMSMDNTVAQLYTLDNEGTQYAINERPYDDGFVQLGASFATDGTYTIALTRGDMGSVFLTDLETGMTTDLTLGEYTFHANAGTDNGRFLLSFAGEGTLTAIEALTNSSAAEYYTIDGRHVGNSRSALGKGVYVVRSGNRSAKILVD